MTEEWQIYNIAKWCMGLSRQTSRYFDDEKHYTYFGMLPCLDLEEGRVK
jgi:hypothetical protein